MVWRKVKLGESYRDVSAFLQYIRELLLGRRHHLHGRFAQYSSPRTIPTPDVPRGPEYKYSNQYYFNRHYMDSCAPPVVAPVAEGPAINLSKTQKSVPGGVKPDTLQFKTLPTPGPAWWWDGHFYYECTPDEIKTNPCPPNTSKL